MSMGARLRKLTSFVVFQGVDDVELNPWPWSIDHRPYHLVNPVLDPDGHGGYARAHHFDEDGVPYVRSADCSIYNPLVVARYGLKMLAISERFGRPEAADRARRMMGPLVDSGRISGAWGTGAKPREMHAQTPSCLTQGVVISTLLRLCEGRPDQRTRDVIELAVERMLAPIEMGGTRSRLGDGDFLEEFPRLPPSHIYNGCVYGLFGLYDLADGLSHERAREVSLRVERTLESAAERFVAPLGWSRYALNVYGHAPLASMHYHVSHIALNRLLEQRTGRPAFSRVADRWERALSRGLTRMTIGLFKASQAFWMRGVRRLPLKEG